MSRNKASKEPAYSKVLGMDGVVIGLRGESVTKDFLLSTVLGLTVVMGIKFISNLSIVFGMVVSVFVFYYLIANRKSKLKPLGNGSLSYYTDDLNKQVVKIKHYNRDAIKRELFSFGMINLVFIECLGVTITITSGSPYSIVTTAGGIITYLVLINILLGVYTSKVGKEITRAIKEYNGGMTIPLNDDEKQAMIAKLGVDDTLFSKVNVADSEESLTGDSEDSEDESVNLKDKQDEYVGDTPTKHEIGNTQYIVEPILVYDNGMLSEELPQNEPEDMYGALDTQALTSAVNALEQGVGNVNDYWSEYKEEVNRQEESIKKSLDELVVNATDTEDGKEVPDDEVEETSTDSETPENTPEVVEEPLPESETPNDPDEDYKGISKENLTEPSVESVTDTIKESDEDTVTLDENIDLYDEVQVITDVELTMRNNNL